MDDLENGRVCLKYSTIFLIQYAEKTANEYLSTVQLSILYIAVHAIAFPIYLFIIKYSFTDLFTHTLLNHCEISYV